jgi:hypothetical protein
MLRACPNLRAHSHFVLLPGPGDSGPSPCLPRPPLPRSLTRPLRGALPAPTLASNPLRLHWRSHQTVLFREDLAAKMRAACVRPPADDGVDASQAPGAALFAHLAATLLQQSHLTPLPLGAAPVHWEWDHALYLLPPPHCLILADRSVPQASTRFEDTVCFNPVRGRAPGASCMGLTSSMTAGLLRRGWQLRGVPACQPSGGAVVRWTLMARVQRQSRWRIDMGLASRTRYASACEAAAGMALL